MLPSSRRVLFRVQNHVAKFATCSAPPKPIQCRFLSQNSSHPQQPHPQTPTQPPKASSPLGDVEVPDVDKSLATTTTGVSQQLSSATSTSTSVEGEEDGADKLYKSIELEILAYEPSVLDSYQWFIMTSAKYLSIPVGKVWSPLKSDKDRFPLLKSAFVHKKHQVHYEIRTYHRFITLHHLTSSTASTFLEYIERNLPEGCGLKVTKVMVQTIPKFLIKSPH